MARGYDRIGLIRFRPYGWVAQLLDFLAQPLVQLLESVQVMLVALVQLGHLALAVLGALGELVRSFGRLRQFALADLQLLAELPLVLLQLAVTFAVLGQFGELALAALGQLSQFPLALVRLREFALAALGQV